MKISVFQLLPFAEQNCDDERGVPLRSCRLVSGAVGEAS